MACSTSTASTQGLPIPAQVHSSSSPLSSTVVQHTTCNAAGTSTIKQLLAGRCTSVCCQQLKVYGCNTRPPYGSHVVLMHAHTSSLILYSPPARNADLLPRISSKPSNTRLQHPPQVAGHRCQAGGPTQLDEASHPLCLQANLLRPVRALHSQDSPNRGH